MLICDLPPSRDSLLASFNHSIANRILLFIREVAEHDLNRWVMIVMTVLKDFFLIINLFSIEDFSPIFFLKLICTRPVSWLLKGHYQWIICIKWLFFCTKCLDRKLLSANHRVKERYCVWHFKPFKLNIMNWPCISLVTIITTVPNPNKIRPQYWLRGSAF